MRTEWLDVDAGENPEAWVRAGVRADRWQAFQESPTVGALMDWDLSCKLQAEAYPEDLRTFYYLPF